jgi:chromosome segregation ATPase
MRQTYATWAVVIVLIGALLGGAFYATSLIDQRDAALAQAQAHVNDLAAANIGFQDQLKSTADARDQLAGDLATRTRERDAALTERDQARTDADSLRQQLATAQKRASDFEAALGGTKNQLDQARQDSSNQQQRATNADARSAAIATVLQLDDKIYSDFYNFLNEVDTMNAAIKRYDYFSAAAAYARAQVIADRLTGLFNQRQAALSKI